MSPPPSFCWVRGNLRSVESGRETYKQERDPFQEIFADLPSNNNSVDTHTFADAFGAGETAECKCDPCAKGAANAGLAKKEMIPASLPKVLRLVVDASGILGALKRTTKRSP